MSTLTRVIKLSGVLASVSLAGVIGLVKFFAILFSDDDAETTKGSPGMPMGETTMGTIEPVATHDDYGEVGSMSGQSVVRHL